MGFRIARAGLLLFISVFLSLGCSKLSTAVGWADNYLSYKIDSEFDFSSAQMRVIDPAIDQMVKDLKVKMFPVYADFLESFWAQLASLNGISELKSVENVFASLGESVQNLQKQTVEVAKPHLQVVVSQIEEGNWKKFEKSFEEKNQDIRQRDTQDQGDKWTERIEDWTGDLNREQEKIVMSWVEDAPWPVELQVKNRNQLLGEFKKRLHKDGKFSPEVRAVIVDDWIKNYEAWAHPDYRPMTKEYYLKMNLMFAQLFLTLSKGQKEKLQKYISSKVIELRELAAK